MKRTILVGYNHPERRDVFDIVKKIKTERYIPVQHCELLTIFEIVKATSKVPGDIAEVGVFRGGTAKVISIAADEDKDIHLFDTFEGLPELTEKDTKRTLKRGDFKSSLEEAREYVHTSGRTDQYFYKGMFPQTGAPVTDKQFSFVHLDVDLYEPTLQSLEYFYPRMSKGGTILSHDYFNKDLDGVVNAFTDFFEDKPEVVIPLAHYQCLVTKL